MSPYDFFWEDVKKCLFTLDRETDRPKRGGLHPSSTWKDEGFYRSKDKSKAATHQGVSGEQRGSCSWCNHPTPSQLSISYIAYQSPDTCGGGWRALHHHHHRQSTTLLPHLPHCWGQGLKSLAAHWRSLFADANGMWCLEDVSPPYLST